MKHKFSNFRLNFEYVIPLKIYPVYLQSKLRELEKRCALQNVLYEELGLEMSSVQRQASRSKSGVNLTTSEVQTSPESETSTPDSALSSSVRMVNGEGSRFALQQQQQKPRLGTQKTDSGLGTLCSLN